MKLAAFGNVNQILRTARKLRIAETTKRVGGGTKTVINGRHRQRTFYQKWKIRRNEEIHKEWDICKSGEIDKEWDICKSEEIDKEWDICKSEEIDKE